MSNDAEVRRVAEEPSVPPATAPDAEEAAAAAAVAGRARWTCCAPARDATSAWSWRSW